jgi:hypothetical protein
MGRKKRTTRASASSHLKSRIARQRNREIPKGRKAEREMQNSADQSIGLPFGASHFRAFAIPASLDES